MTDTKRTDTNGGADFNQLFRVGNHLVVIAETFRKEENLFQVHIPTFFKDMVEQLNFAQKIVEVDQTNRKTFVTLLRYNVDKPQNSYAQLYLFARTS